jgi:hypothetical protein
MQKKYQVTSNSFYFGLACEGKEKLPCVYSRLWLITEGLVGFRQGSKFGIYSLKEDRVIYEPVLHAEIPYFKTHFMDRENKMREPRYVSTHGFLVKRKVYLETYDYLMWHKNRLLVMGPEGVVVILKNGKIRPFNGKNPELVAQYVSKRCITDGEYGLIRSSQKHFQYLTKADEAIDEHNFLNSLDDNMLDFSGTDTEELNEEDDEEEEPVYKHYNYDAIPSLIKQKLLNHLKDQFDFEKYEWLPRVLIYLAWCHANNFVEYDSWGNCTIDPMYAMEPEDAKHVFDIAMLYEAHQMGKLQHLLYFSSLTNSYLDVLAYEN